MLLATNPEQLSTSHLCLSAETGDQIKSDRFLPTVRICSLPLAGDRLI
ncbi:MAG: hypothetical protein KME06_11775 [Kastovskya adunca ATA6-11-RM4]|nr:hypothetical protein [Kastovskya adunca ATA6-11-RM4]